MTEQQQASTTAPSEPSGPVPSTPITTTSITTADAAPALQRRSVLLATGALAGAGALAACSSPAQPTGTTGGGSSSAAAGASESGSASGGSGSGSGSGTATSEVPVGGAKFFPDTKTVVTQPEAGTFKAFDTTCPHNGCAVASVEGDQLVCPCHQSHFALATGDVVSGPAPTGLTAKTVTVSGTTFTVS